MKIAVLSGKGGAGKTLTAVNLAIAAKNSIYIDCDVEEPNGRLFFKPENIKSEEVYSLIPSFDKEKCTGCRKCLDFCRFNALSFIRNKPKVFSEVCHSCGGCEIICPEYAVKMEKRSVGKIEYGTHNAITVVTGILNMGEASGVPIIKAALNKGFSINENVIIDCPPGSACSVMESIDAADLCLIVAEPTAFGFHNFKMVYELAEIMQKPVGIIINKEDEPYLPLNEFCKEKGAKILARIPFSEKLAKISSVGDIISEKDDQYANLFKDILMKVGGLI